MKDLGWCQLMELYFLTDIYQPELLTKRQYMIIVLIELCTLNQYQYNAWKFIMDHNDFKWPRVVLWSTVTLRVLP